MDKYGWPTTRCYPRTTAEAFRDDVEYSQWWYPPEQRWQDKLFLAVAVCLWLVIAVYLMSTTV